jgi:DNA invertase Pin-like site-specific DNA recombinase
MDRHPAAYIRRSHVDPQSPGDISEAAQLAAVKKLAAVDGHNGDMAVYSDWGISADVAKSRKRTDYTRLLADMEAGRVSSLYAFDVDRLYRDPRDLIRLQDAAQRHRVEITTTAGRLAISDGDDPAAEGFAFITAVFGRMELLKAKKRVRAAMTARRARGDVLGKPPYGSRFARDGSGRVTLEAEPTEPVEPILAAFREAGTFGGAARLLNARGVRARFADHWSGTTVARVVRQSAPGAAPDRLPAGRRSRHPVALAGLLICPCGQLMTTRESFTRSKYGTFGPYVSYQCPRARYTPGHPRPYMVGEALLMPWIRAEAAHLAVPGDAVKLGEGTDREAEREALTGKRARWIEQYGEGLIDKPERDRRLAAVTDALAELERRAEAETLFPVAPVIEWDTWTPDVLNRVLRALWRHVQLGPDLRPVSAERLVPEWWAD